MKKVKTEVITFKADTALLEALSGVPNRSAFIRNAVSEALASTCPLCQGKGFLTPHQKQHWDHFSRDHRLEECANCHEMHIICRERESRKKKTEA